MAAINPGTFQYREPDGDPFPGATQDSPSIPLTGKFQHRRENGDPPIPITAPAVALGALGGSGILGILWKGPWTS